MDDIIPVAKPREYEVLGGKKPEEKKETQINWAIPLITVIIIICAAGFLFFAFSEPKYKYSVERDGIIFYSNSFPPANYVSAAGAEQNFIISPAVFESGTTNQYMVQSLTMLNVILTKNNKNLTTIARVYDDSGNLMFCHTNDGNVHIDREISKEECEQMLANNDATKIFISFPNSELPKSEIILEEKNITINPMNFRDVSYAPLVLMRAMYADSDKVISTINDFVHALNQ
jgi:hypothetical protein